MLRRLSLRARLVLGVFALAATGLAVADVATYTSLRSFLVDRLDRSVAVSAHSLADSIAHRGQPDPGEVNQLAGSVPGVYVGIRTPAGKTTWDAAGTRPGDTPLPEPRLSGSIEPDETVELGAASGSTRYRTRAEPLPQGYLLLVAAPLRDVNGTLHRLLLIELLVTAAVLAAVATLGLWVIRLGLRPLHAIEDTARAIAGGDLTRRVDRAEERTEVGRLGLALNTMLGQIESAFLAQEASEQKLRRFVSDASHELRTPLAAVRAYAELFTRGAADRPDDLARSMSGITRESERMSVLVEDLLLLARLDEGRPLEQEPVDLDSVIAEAVETARAVEPDRPIAVELRPAVVTGDRDRLRQIVDNLLANVRAHTPAGTRVRVSLSAADEQAVISVADDGPGMTVEQAEHVFERFYRVDSSRARTSGGVGLGLSIVAAVAEAHGGAVSAQSELGKGATMSIELPLRRP